MKKPRQLWLLAGGNGAGKSTFHRLFLEPRGIRLVNADQVAREIYPARPAKVAYQAAYLTIRLVEDLLEQGTSFCYETVFSHVSKIDLIARAKSLGYEIILVYLHLDTPELNQARVQQRVAAGGHPVPHEKIRSRIPRTMKHIRAVLPLADQARLFNNSSHDAPFQTIAVVRRGRLVSHSDPLPPWAQAILKGTR